MTWKRARRFGSLAAGVVAGASLLLGGGDADAVTTPNVGGTVRLPAGQTFNGTNVVPFSQVTARDGTGSFVASTNASSTGTYELVLDDGTYSIRASAPSGSPYGAGQITVTVSGPAAPAGSDIVVPPANVTGQVRAPGGGALPDGLFPSIDVRDAEGDFIPNGPAGASTNAGASYNFGLTLPAGTYALRASAFGSSFTPGQAVVTVPSSGGPPVVNIELTTPNVTGKVFQPNGTTPVQTSVQVRTASGGFAPGIDGAFSAGDGSFALRLPAGTWQLRAQAAGAFAEGIRTVTVVAGSTLTGQDILLRAPNLTVNVKNPAGANVQFASINVNQSGGAEPHFGSTGSDGNARFVLPAGSYVVTASPPFDSDFASSLPVSVTIAAGGAPQTINLALRAPNVSGRVTGDSGSGPAPLGNAFVSVFAGATTTGSPVATTQSASNGTFSVALNDGSYTAIVQPPFGSPFGRSDPIAFNVAGSVSLGDIQLPRANVSGTVFRPDGTTPVANASLFFHTIDYSQTGFANTLSSGAYNVRLAPGTYIVDVTPPFGSADGGAQGEITVIQGTPLTANFTLRTPNVSGVVTTPDRDAQGNPLTPSPVASTTVFVHNDDWSFRTNATTDSSGAFRLFLPSTGGPFTIQAHPPGGSDYDRSAEITLNGPTSDSVVLRLTIRNVTGRVFFGAVTSDLSTVAPATGVEIRSTTFDFFTYASTDDEGKFRVALPPGKTYVAVARPSGTSAFTASPPLTITVASDGTVTPAQIDLVLGKPQLRATVVDAAGAPAGSGYAFVHNATYTESASAPVQQDGTLSVGGLPAGTYVLELYPPFNRSELLHTRVTGIVLTADEATWPVTMANNPDGKVHYAAATRTIRVRVQREDGTAITSGASVSAFQFDGGFAHASTPTAGVYDLKVDEGNWNVSVHPTAPGTNWIFARDPVHVAVDSAHDDGSHVFPVTLRVRDATAHVTGRVLAADGTPVSANTAFVYVGTRDGVGNGRPVGAGGTFDVTVPGGSYHVFVHSQDAQLGSPPAVRVTVDDGQTAAVGDIRLLLRDARIQGTVAFASGAPLAGVQVFAWQPEGGFADAVTQEDGSYTLRVTGGDWRVGIWPQPDDTWVYAGGPLGANVAAGGTLTGRNFTVSAVAGRIEGTVLTPAGEPVDTSAWAVAIGGSGESGAPVVGGSFSIPVTPGTYSVQVFLPPGSGFVSTQTATATVAADGTITPASLSLTLAARDRTITGRVVNRAGTPLGAGSVRVFASDANGNYQVASVAADGTYSLAVGLGTWHVGADVEDPGLSLVGLGNGSGGSASPTVTFLAGGAASQTRDVVVDLADQHLVGDVRTASGGAVPFAWVSADSPPGATAQVHAGGFADETGHFDLRVPAGTYVLTAAAPVPGEGAPRALTVDAAAGSQSVSPLVLAFRQRAATITGNVSAPVAGLTIKVTAWSDQGGVAETTADAAGNYSLQVAGGDTWHIDAGALSGTQAYVSSAGVAVVVGASGPHTAEQIVLAALTVPAALTATFDSTRSTVIRFGDVELSVPAGTLATSGDVRITASPEPNPDDTLAAHPVGLGYTFQAFDANGAEITSRFPNKIRITFPYDPTELAALGLAPQDLIPAFQDPASGAYVPIDDVVIDTVAHTISGGTDHFTSFVLSTSTLAAPTVTAVSPGSTTAGAAQTLTITGTGFVSGASVRIGSFTATGATVLSPTSVRATVPATVPSGTYTVTVANSDGRSGSKTSALTLTGDGAIGPAAPAAAPDLAVRATAFPASVRVGETLTYIVTVSSENGARASGITLVAELPDGVSLIDTMATRGPGRCTGTSTLTCVLDFLEGSTVATVRIVVRVQRAGELVNRLALRLAESDPVTANNSLSLRTVVEPALTRPTVRVAGPKSAAIRLAYSGRTAVVASRIAVGGAATLEIRILAGLSRTPVAISKGSRVGSATVGRARTVIISRTGRAGEVALRLLTPRSRLERRAWLHVVAIGTGGRTTLLVPLRR